ncbi:hypothetical protein ACFOY8_14090 [Thalassospira xianhensis]|uniref:Uncharacterized protein n=1 Tax=Thalassospira xianhensis MCCC 1A02616 TaxID=1177929 RepID=A0A367UI63_9PROT|nr:hypothetical protein [Thalassospira xianhensis]RCK07711.1 hypothetical protein TH5_01180 [Thalassospira xianhensis MCCC 1A02616]
MEKPVRTARPLQTAGELIARFASMTIQRLERDEDDVDISNLIQKEERRRTSPRTSHPKSKKNRHRKG